MWLCLHFRGSGWQAAMCHFAHHLGWDKCGVSPKMIIVFSWKSTQVCLYTTCTLQHVTHADLEHLEKAVQGPSISLFIDLPGQHQMVCYFLLSTACHQHRNPACWKWCIWRSRNRLQMWDLCQWKVWHTFCGVSVGWINTEGQEGCYFNLHAIVTHFGWNTQNAPDTYVNGKYSIFVRQTIL